MTGDAFLAGEPAQARIAPLPEAPKPTHETTDTEAAIENETASGDAPGDRQGSVIALAGRTREAAETAAVMRSGSDQVTVRAKPEKRKNYKERAKAKFTKDGTTPDMTATAKSEVKEKAKTEAKAKAKIERRKAKAGQKAKKSKAA